MKKTPLTSSSNQTNIGGINGLKNVLLNVVMNTKREFEEGYLVSVKTD